MFCQQCKKHKNETNFYLIDGGLGCRNDKMHRCKDCIKDFNDNKRKHKYHDEQIYAQYYGALEILKGNKLGEIAQKIDNGIAESSNKPGIENFLYLITDGEKGFSNYSKQQQRIYEIFQKQSGNQSISYPDEINDENLFEGAKKVVTVNAYERSQKARQKCINTYGYDCFICGFNFEKIYGAIGRDFIHVHHIKPLSEIKEEYEIKPIEDLRPVCPNCHAMLHIIDPAYSIGEIKSFINENDLMTPNPELVEYNEAKELMIKLNEKLDNEHQIGHSYFMKIENEKDLAFTCKYKIEPLLEEYFYGDKDGFNSILEVLNNNS